MGLMQLMVQLGLNATGYETGLKRADSAGRQFGNALSREIGGKIATAFSFVAVQQAVSQTVEYGSKVQDLANRLGISTDAVQQWDYALKQNGGSIESAAGFFEKLAISRDKALKGSGAQIAAFEKLGVTLNQLKSSRVEDVAAVIAKAFESGDPQALIGPLKEVGGKGAGEMVAAFVDGLGDALKDAPLISAADIESLDRAADALDRLKAEGQSTIAPIIADLADAALTAIDVARKLLSIPVGFLMGAVESYKQAWSEEGMLGLAKNFMGGFIGGGVVKGGFEGAKEAWDAVDEQQKERDRAAEERKARLAKGHGKSPLEETEDKQNKAAEKEAEAVRRIHADVAEIQRKAAMQSMTATEKRAALEQHIAKLRAEADLGASAGGWTERDIAEQERTIAQRETELAGIKEDKKESRRDVMKSAGSKPALIDIGNYLTGGDPNRVVHEKLDVLHMDLQQLIKKEGPAASGITFPES